jgi:hypothetical protein
MMSKFMKLTIENAKKTAQLFNARQVVVCAFDYAGRFGIVSYGVTKDECRNVRPLCDAIADGLMDGTLPEPDINQRP